MRLLPRSLFGQLMLILAGGLTVAQLLSAAVNLVERDELLVRASGLLPAQRVADTVWLLESLSATERARVVGVLDLPPFVVSLDRVPTLEQDTWARVLRAEALATGLRSLLGDERPVRIASPRPGSKSSAALPRAVGPGKSEQDPGAHRLRNGRSMTGDASSLIQVRLNDGTWVTFDGESTPAVAPSSWRLLGSMGILIVVALLLAWFAVRRVVQPLHALAAATEALGENISGPSISETGPIEVVHAAHTLNIMQTRMIRFIEERTRLLAAMTHDLKTPLTRMRLETAMLEDDGLRRHFESDLSAMEALVRQTLELLGSLERRDPAKLVDIMPILKEIEQENHALGLSVSIDGQTQQQTVAMPGFLKRCIANLVCVAVGGGTHAEIHVIEAATGLTILVRGQRTGGPAPQLQEIINSRDHREVTICHQSRSAEHGLGIARSIARAHGGEVRLYDLPSGGTEASLTLPWCRT